MGMVVAWCAYCAWGTKGLAGHAWQGSGVAAASAVPVVFDFAGCTGLAVFAGFAAAVAAGIARELLGRSLGQRDGCVAAIAYLKVRRMGKRRQIGLAGQDRPGTEVARYPRNDLGTSWALGVAH